MTVRARQNRSRTRRAARTRERIKMFESRVTTETKACSGKVVVLGYLDGRIVYSSKPLTAGNKVSAVRQQWIRRMSRRLVGVE